MSVGIKLLLSYPLNFIKLSFQGVYQQLMVEIIMIMNLQIIKRFHKLKDSHLKAPNIPKAYIFILSTNDQLFLWPLIETSFVHMLVSRFT